MQIYFRSWECITYQNRLIFARVIDKSLQPRFYAPQCSQSNGHVENDWWLKSSSHDKITCCSGETQHRNTGDVFWCLGAETEHVCPQSIHYCQHTQHPLPQPLSQRWQQEKTSENLLRSPSPSNRRGRLDRRLELNTSSSAFAKRPRDGRAMLRVCQ